MNVIDMPVQVVLIPEGVFPEPALPNPHLALSDLRGRDFPGDTTFLQILVTEPGFDHLPAGGIIAVILGEGPDTMQVIRQ
jgi:hypothetical protein